MENDGSLENLLARPITTEDREWVQRMIERGHGITANDIQDASPHLQPYDKYGEKVWCMISRSAERNPVATAVTQVQAMLAIDRQGCDTRFDILDCFWVGNSQGPGQSITAFDLINKPLINLNPHPKFIVPNGLSSEAAGEKGTQRPLPRDSDVKVGRLMVIKFDDLTVEEQTAFWGGVLKTDILKVVTLVSFSNKTIHALVEVEGDYVSFKEKVLRLCCSDEDPHYHCDQTVLHPSALTCLAGAECPSTGRYHELLFARFA